MFPKVLIILESTPGSTTALHNVSLFKYRFRFIGENNFNSEILFQFRYYALFIS